MRKTLLRTLGFWLLAFPAAAQLDNCAFDRLPTPDSLLTPGLWLDAYALGFCRNNEFNNLVADGYTLFGYQAAPRLIYYTGPLQVEAGVFVRQDFGNPQATQVSPLFTLRYRRRHLEFLFGNLRGALAHRLLEPLFDFERVITDRFETGAQLRYESPGLSADAWINWETMIYPNSPVQEEFTVGLRLEPHWRPTTRWTITPSSQTLVYHAGGQIDTTDLPVTTIWNTSLGVRAQRRTDRRWLDALTLEGYRLYSRHPRAAFAAGDGWLGNLTARVRGVDVMLTYWRATEWIAPRGGQLYQSVSSRFDRPEQTLPRRELIFLRLLYDLPLTEEVVLTARLEPFYDNQSRQIEFSMGLYVHFGRAFRLATLP